MTDINSSNSIRSRSELPPPRFDERAHLRAQPVRPIRKSRITGFFERVFADSTSTLALIVVLGFLTGALIGVSLVGQNTSAPEANGQALALPAENQPPQLGEAAVGVYGIQTQRANIRSGGSRRSRVTNNGEPRAYRFAVIR